MTWFVCRTTDGGIAVNTEPMSDEVLSTHANEEAAFRCAGEILRSFGTNPPPPITAAVAAKLESSL